ncbi:MAG: hypothetical protein CME43_14000 [Haliea sp.]|uniref:PqqD family peptide modification chaperone n=1 Tax=Haliea sp. TaxID=1932666 RepID=UPI000C5161C7|nr:PqqD family peptide modification chaperone [Haliea sp.]MBM70577.1 hypothetical protein [Haliea sp.]|tara:strand:- start:4673 stop:5917 length:1245 start_codon:yes stop_codon:yes gene_type:complete
MNSPDIFISIAAYREFDLPATLASLLSMADTPSRLRVCVYWQRAPEDSLGDLADSPQLEILDVPYQQSRGVCWARNRIQQQYRGERYFLQLDGHHRFAPGWDSALVTMLEGLRGSGVQRPVLTTYLPAFDPENDPAARSPEIWLLGADRFDDSGVVFMRPYIPVEPPEAPVPTRFWSAHFSFSDGAFVHDVPIDPNGYFHGEEIGTCVRAWTSGYDFFCPHRTLVWHEYSRKGRRCHWDDHSDWSARNEAALARYRALVGVDGVAPIDLDGYGLGTARSLADYEQFAGLCFADRYIAPETLAHAPPTLPDCLQDAGARSGGVLRATADTPRIPQRDPRWSEEQLEGEWVLYNEDTTRACYLNDSAALIWQLIDGERSTGEIRALLEGAYGEAVGIYEDLTLVLSQLRSQGAIRF